MDKKVIRVGADPFPPYQYMDEHGQAAGSDYEKVAGMLRDAGYEMEITIDDWDVVEQKFMDGELDALFQVQKSPERERYYQFSPLLRNAVTEVITGKEGVQLQTYGEIVEKGLSLGVLRGYSYGKEIDGLPNACKKEYAGSGELLRDIADCKVDLGVFDQGVKEYLMGETGIDKVYSVKGLEFIRPLYIMY